MELWLILSILTGTFFGFQAILLKILSQFFNHAFILKFLFLIAGILLIPAIFFTPLNLELRPFLMAFFISLSLNTVAYLLLLKAIARYPVSIVMPFVALTPLFLTLTAYLILGETLNQIKIIGIVLIVCGSFILQLPKNWRIKDWRSLINWQEKGIWLMILIAFIWSITASVEKIAVIASSPEFYGASIHLSLGVVFLLMSKKQVKNVKNVPKNKKLLLIAIGIISALLAWCQLLAIKLTYVSYVIAFKRAGVLISTILAFIVLKEKNYLKSLTGTILIILGATLITL